MRATLLNHVVLFQEKLVRNNDAGDSKLARRLPRPFLPAAAVLWSLHACTLRIEFGSQWCQHASSVP